MNNNADSLAVYILVSTFSVKKSDTFFNLLNVKIHVYVSFLNDAKI